MPVREVYQSTRESHLAAKAADLAAKKTVTPDKALVAHLARKASDAKTGRDTSSEVDDINCMGFLARLPRPVLDVVLRVQQELVSLLGPEDLWLAPEEVVHLSVLEVSHRHSMEHLRAVECEVSTSRLQEMLDYVSNLAPRQPALECPQLNLDNMGIALNFLPVSDEEYTYHHLRRDLQARLLDTGISIDTCYTAPTAHVTIGRFIGDAFFREPGAMDKLLAKVAEINRLLRDEYWPGADSPGSHALVWRVGEDIPFELQLGYLKFGRSREKASLLGRRIADKTS